MSHQLTTLEQKVRPRHRRLAFAVLAIAFAVLSVIPWQYRARVQLMPPQSSSSGLGALLSQLGGLGGFSGLLSTRQPVEVYLVLARSNDVALAVAKRTLLLERFGVATPERAVKKLARVVDIHSLRGGVIEIEVLVSDRKLALDIAAAYAEAFQDRLAVLARDSAERKRTLMNDQLRRASARLTEAEDALTRYRTANRVASPEAQLGSSVALLASLRARLQAREVELTAAREFATDSSYEVQRVESEIAALRGEITKVETSGNGRDPFGFQAFTRKSSEYLRLYRDAKYAEALYELYARHLEAVNVEEVSASINAQVVETPFIEPGLRLRVWAVGVAALLVAIAAWLELRARRLTRRALSLEPVERPRASAEGP
jgi:uncharacterized protein involved in exopolysaccharide biosynthesis